MPVAAIQLPSDGSSRTQSSRPVHPDGTPTPRRGLHHQPQLPPLKLHSSSGKGASGGKTRPESPLSPWHRHKLPYRHSAADRASYRHCRSLCTLIGDLYPWLDMPAGVCFVVGSLLFIAGPVVALVNPEASIPAIVWPQLVGVVFFTLAKVFAESKAIYAHFYKKPAKRSGPSYHLAIISLLLGGMLFLVAYVLQLEQNEETKQYETPLQWCNTVGSVLFALGSSLLIFNARSQFFPRELCHNPHNLYLISGIWLLIGSCGYVLSSAESIPPADSMSERTIQIISVAAGCAFLVGSTLLLAFSIFEAGEMDVGPDPEATFSRPEHEEGNNAPHRVKRRKGRNMDRAEEDSTNEADN